MPPDQQFLSWHRNMKSSSIQKNVNQALSLGSRPITRKNLPGVPLKGFDGWYAADLGVSTVSSVVSEWANQVPGGPTLTQTDADERPALSAINNITALDFDGDTSSKNTNADNAGDSGGLLMDGIGTGDFYIAFVIAVDSTSDAMTFFSKALSSGIGLTNQFNCEYASNRFSVSVSGSALATTATGQLVQGQTTLVEFHRLNGTLQIFNNGTSVASVSDSTDITHAGVVKIGATTQNNRFPFNGQIGEFICKAGTVPVKTRQIIEALMATKWNLGAAKTEKARGRAAGFGILPATNRFRNRPPRF